MKWNLKIGRFFGIDVHLHFTFLLVLGFLTLAHWLTTRQVGAALSGAAFFAAIFGCVLLHEFGHALMARRFGVGTRDITLLPIGGVARLERMPDKPVLKKILVALAGGALLIVGLAMVFLPGPAIVVIPAALAILALEFVWARRWLAWLRECAKTLPMNRRRRTNSGNCQFSILNSQFAAACDKSRRFRGSVREAFRGMLSWNRPAK